MTAVLRVKQAKESLNEDQKVFRRLNNQLKMLQEKEKKRTVELDEALLFYHEKMRMEEEKIDQALEERVYCAYLLYKKSRSLSKGELNTLRNLILSDVEALLKSVGIQSMPKKVEEIGRALGWEGAEAALMSELNPLVEDIENMFASQGIKIDLSHIDVKDSPEEMLRKFCEQVGASMDQREDLSQETLPKKSKKLQQVHELQEKSLNALYRQLAKALHPDLEPDVEKKAKKEEQMKRVTLAYKNRDLSTLLELEKEWIDSARETSAIRSSDQLKIYNGVLKEQVAVLKERIDMLFLHPKYFPIQRFYPHHFTGMPALLKAYQGMKMAVKQLQFFVDKLQSPQAEKFLKQTLQREQTRQE